MKTLVIYYSFSGITERVVNMFAETLHKKGDLTIQRLRPQKEITSFIGQCRAAFTKKRADIIEVGIQFDASPYDLIIIGCPVWAFAPTPAVNTYLDKVSGLTAKRVIILLTSGSGAGVGKCFANIESVLRSKGVASVDRINIPNSKMKDLEFVKGSLENIL